MGKLKTRLSSRKNASRWKKGQSSSSNPKTTKFRDAARSNYFQLNLNSQMSNLTIDKLKKHDIIQGTPVKNIEDDEDMDGASTCKTMNTYASNYSKCSNMSFNGFLSHFQINSEMHKQMLATLRTVSDNIKANGGTESTTEYFASFISALKSNESEENESEETIAAIITLLGMTMKNLQKSVLKQKFGLVNQLLLQNLIKYTEKKNDYIQRHCIGCISLMLRAQEKAVWSEDSAKNTLATILKFTIHGKPKLRKASHHAVISLLKESEIMKQDHPPEYHPAVPQVAKHLVEQLDNAQRHDLRTAELYTLTLLKQIWHQFPKNYIKTICNQMMANMKLNNDIIVATSCFETLYSLFASRPSENDMPAEMNAQIINALYDYQPSNESSKLLLPWLTTVLEALCNLASSSLDLCAANVPKFLSTCLKIWGETSKQEIQDGVATKIKETLTLCVLPLCVDDQLNKIKRSKSVLLETIKILSTGLNFVYNTVWRQVFNLLATLFQIIGPVTDTDVKEALKNVLRHLVDLRESKNISFPGDADYAIGAAVKSLGAETVLDVAPLVTDENINLSRYEWLYFVLDTCTSNATIAYFQKNFLNRAIIYELMYEKKKKENDTTAKSQMEMYKQISTQLWALFPTFCNNATDIATTLEPNFAICLGKALDVDKKHLHSIVISGLRKMLLKAIENEDKADKDRLSRYSKNFLPRLNNIYLMESKGTHEQGNRASALETIKIYLKLNHADMISVIKKLNAEARKGLEKADSDFKKEGLYDLIMVYSQYTDLSQLNEFYQAFKPLLKDNTKQKEQKKAYRFLEEICNSETEVCKKFLESNWEDLKESLVASSDETLGPSKGPRIRIFTALLESCASLENDIKFLSSVVIEATIGVKEQNAKCRASSFDLFNVIAERFMDDTENFGKFIDIVMAGLGGTPFYRSATILVLTSILYNYNVHLNIDTQINILDCILEQIQEPIREVVKSSFAFVKIFLSVSPNIIIMKRIENIIKALCGMTEDCKRHFRLKVRDVLTKMVRKYGIDAVTSMVPKSDEVMLKRLKNIRKTEARKQKSKKDKPEKDENEEFEMKRGSRTFEEILADSDEDSEDDVKSKKENREARKRKGAWIQEETDKILDFTDPGVSKKITTAKPTKKELPSEEGKTKKKDRGFKIAPDGRMIISDAAGCDDDDNEPTHKKKKRKTAFPDEDGDDNYEEDEEDKKSMKSTKSTMSMKSNKSSTTYRTASTYKAGGSGIHRPLNPGEEYRAKKARGDVKKKGKLEPYAYFPLRRSSLNRRKKFKKGF